MSSFLPTKFHPSTLQAGDMPYTSHLTPGNDRKTPHKVVLEKDISKLGDQSAFMWLIITDQSAFVFLTHMPSS